MAVAWADQLWKRGVPYGAVDGPARGPSTAAINCPVGLSTATKIAWMVQGTEPSNGMTDHLKLVNSRLPPEFHEFVLNTHNSVY